MKPLLVILIAALSLPAAGLRAGAARIDITPQGPIWMSGYAVRNKPSEGVRHPIFVRALAIDSGSGPVVFVSTDLIGLPFEVSDEVAARARKQFGIERSRLLLNSSHTHTGPVIWPNLVSMWNLPAGEDAKLRAYSERLVNDLVSVIGSAVKDLSPAEVSYGFGEADSR
jgi:hypothetical protein